MKHFLKLLVFIFVAIAIFWYRDRIFNFSSKLLPEIRRTTDLIVEEIKPRIFAPSPLRAPEVDKESFLTRSGIIRWSNVERANNGGLPALKENQGLSLAAAEKVRDMFEKQYFAHIAPDGRDAGDLAVAVGYSAIMIGENLALGNFGTDRELVQAWMDSPGHRENILNSRFREIGVAVQKGAFEGRSTWLAVQIFGLSRSACPAPDPVLRSEIEREKRRLDHLKEDLLIKKNEVEQLRKTGPRADYNREVEAYNILAGNYNNLIEQTKILVSRYNEQVGQTNACISGGESHQ